MTRTDHFVWWQRLLLGCVFGGGLGLMSWPALSGQHVMASCITGASFMGSVAMLGGYFRAKALWALVGTAIGAVAGIGWWWATGMSETIAVGGAAAVGALAGGLYVWAETTFG